MTVLNKSKWKGGTIQIEQARETFLQKLAQERHEAAEKVQSPSVDHKVKLVESMKEAGVENFHMKAAVPGTEIPGHKDWVVSKFGRVLPVLNLKCQGRNKISFSSCPSSLWSDLERKILSKNPTPVSQLTWEMSGGDDDISKKRRGEFPPQKTPPAKKRKAISNQVVSNGQSGSTVQKSNGETRPPTKPKHTPAPKKPQTQTSVYVFDSGDDSDGDVRMLAQRSAPADGPVVDEDEDNLEVVGDNYIPKTFLTQQKTKDFCQLPMGSSRKNQEDYDSADTDEILNFRKTPSGTKQDQLPEVSKTQEKAEVDYQTNNPETDRAEAKKANKSEESDSSKAKKTGKKVVSKKKTPPSELSSDDRESYEDKSEASTDSEYEAMFTNCQRLEFSLDDLQQLVKESFLKGLDRDSDDDDPGSDSQQPGPNRVSDVLAIEPQATASKAPVPPAKTGNGNTPEEILAAIFEEDNSDEVSEKKKKGKKKKTNPSTSLPAFQGTKALLATSSQTAGQHSLKRQVEEDGRMETSTKKQKHDRLVVSKPSASEEEDAKTVAKPSETKGTTRPPSSSDSEDITESPALKQKTTSKAKAERTVEPTALKQKPTSAAKAEKKSGPAASSTSSSSSSGSSSLESEMEEDVPTASRSVPAKKTQKAEVCTLFSLCAFSLSLCVFSLLLCVFSLSLFSLLLSLVFSLSHSLFVLVPCVNHSKLARKKKREEAEKLPEVSREMYYDVSMDLKEVFGTSKEEKTEEEEENVAWDKEEEETSQAMAVDPVIVSSHLSTNEGEASSGFKFSFFGGDTAAETTTEKEEYRIETLKGAKVSWQVDPRFQDSSDEEEEEEEAKEQTDTTTPTE
uniref:Nucleolar protein 8 n=1 Tax=Hucho hucho TaxID=62062 RepID=A0A4W5JZ85_9TELE